MLRFYALVLGVTACLAILPRTASAGVSGENPTSIQTDNVERASSLSQICDQSAVALFNQRSPGSERITTCVTLPPLGSCVSGRFDTNRTGGSGTRLPITEQHLYAFEWARGTTRITFTTTSTPGLSFGVVAFPGFAPVSTTNIIQESGQLNDMSGGYSYYGTGHQQGTFIDTVRDARIITRDGVNIATWPWDYLDPKDGDGSPPTNGVYYLKVQVSDASQVATGSYQICPTLSDGPFGSPYPKNEIALPSGRVRGIGPSPSSSNSPTLTVSAVGSGSISSNIGGIQCGNIGSTCSVSLDSGQQVILTETPGPGWSFAGWGGACSGTAGICQVTLDSAKSVSAAFTQSVQPNPSTTATLSIIPSGGIGGISTTPSGIACPTTCSATFTTGQQVTIRATPNSGYKFVRWEGGACAGSSSLTCSTTMTSDQVIGAVFAPVVSDVSGLRLGSIYPSTNPTNLSFFRFINTGNSTGTVQITLADAANGIALGTWPSTNIAAGAEVQYSMGTIEQGAGIAPLSQSSFYSVSIQSTMTGYVQHVLYRPSDGTLTNLSTCSSGVTSMPNEVAGVHSSLLGRIGFPSSVVVFNAGQTAASAILGVYDAATGSRYPTYTTPTVPPNGHLIIPVSSLEQTAPGLSTYHYVVKIENPSSFSGFLQHTVNNQLRGVITDMSTVCALDTAFLTTAPDTIRLGSVYSSAQSTTQSYLRLFNTGVAGGTVDITVLNPATGQAYGTWTSPSIPVGASPQFPITQIENALNIVGFKPSTYSILVQPQVSGYFEHVLYRPLDGTLTNASTCSGGVTSSASQISNVHSWRLATGFPATVVVYNNGSAAASATLGIYDAATGAKLATYFGPSTPSNGQSRINMSDIENATGLSNSSSLHYTIKIENQFTGFLQHIVTNQSAGVITDMTTSCGITGQVPPKLTVSVAGSGSVKSDPAGINCGSSMCFATFPKGQQVTLTATPQAGQVFSKWTDTSGLSSCNNSTSPTCTVTVNYDATIGAAFAQADNGQGVTFTLSSLAFSWGPGTLQLTVDNLLNASNVNTTGPLRLDVWLFSQPYTGSGTGYRMGQSANPIYNLQPGTGVSHLETSMPFLIGIPHGTYYATVFVFEQSSSCTAADHYCFSTYRNLNSPVVY